MKPQMIVVEQLYHHAGDGTEPFAKDASFVRELASDEQVYERVMRVGGEWLPLDLGWLKDRPIGTMRLENLREPLTTQPTEEERAERAGRVIELVLCTGDGMHMPFALVPPGESARFAPVNAGRMFLRCLSGSTKINLCLVPG